MNEVKELVEELRNKKSRDNRELLDRSADMIEKLAKELCEKSGCHHKCHDTKDCVVEDEALLLINENKSNNSDFKSNNFEVKSNEELFKQALVEGLNRHFDREIEEAKKIEQIEEMIEIVKPFVSGLACEEESGSCELTDCRNCKARDLSNKLYNAGYRKQSEGEWIKINPNNSLIGEYYCSCCNSVIDIADGKETPLDREMYYCPNCGAKMKGGE